MSPCLVCGKSFSRSDNLKTHIKNIHEKMTQEVGMAEHHLKNMHPQCESCTAVGIPQLIHPFTCLVACPWLHRKCVIDPVGGWTGGIRQRREYVEVAMNMMSRRKTHKYQKNLQTSSFPNQTLMCLSVQSVASPIPKVII